MTAESIQPHVKKERQQQGESIAAGKTYTPYTDIAESPDALIVTMDLPGVDRDRLEITLDKDQLRVDGKIDDTIYQGLRAIYTEYNVGHFTRSFSLSQRIDQDGIAAEMQDGVLTLRLPKVDEAKPRRIKVT